MGFVPRSLFTMGQRPALLASSLGLACALQTTDQLDPGLVQLVAHIASTAAGCRYCQAHTGAHAARNGVADGKLAVASEFETSGRFSAAADERDAFNRSSQHLETAVLCGKATWVDGDADGAAGDAVGRSPVRRDVERGFLRGDRQGAVERGCRDRVWCVRPGRCALVPRAGWHAVDPAHPPSGRYLSFAEREDIALRRG
jgi:alkylhydroperoxidase family enzyme